MLYLYKYTIIYETQETWQMDYQQSRAYVKDADRYAGGALDLTNIK